MNTENIKVSPSEITTETIHHQADAWIKAAENAMVAAEAYLDDIAKRKAALTEQAQGLQTQLEELSRQQNALAAKVNDLSSRGKFDEAANKEAQLEAAEKSITALTRKLRLVNSTELKGDPAFYKAAKTAHEAMEAERAPYRASIAELQDIVNAEIERLEAVSKELLYAAAKDPGHYAYNMFEKVDRHFRDLDRIERERKEKETAERKAQQEMSGRTFHIFS